MRALARPKKNPPRRILGFLGGIFLALFCAIFPLNQDLAISLEGSAKVAYLLKTLETANDYKVRMAAASTLGKIGDGSVADWMIRAFRRETNSAVRLAILYGIANIPDHRILPPLLELVHQEIVSEKELLTVERIFWNCRKAISIASWSRAATNSDNRSERAMAAWLLGIVGNSRDLSSLLRATKDHSAYVRTRSVQALGRLGHRKGLAPCRQLRRRDPDITVRRASATCVGMISLQSRARLPKEKNHRVNLGLDLKGMQSAAVSLTTFRRYQRKNVNPREIEVAASVLRPVGVVNRGDRTVQLVTSEKIRQTFRLDAKMVSKYRFHTVDIGRLKRVVKDEVGNVNRCYLKGLEKTRGLKGSVTLGFRVLGTGKVSKVKVKKSTLKHKGVHKCMMDKIRKFRFPRIEADFVTMNYTFTFAPAKDQKFEF